MNVKLKLLFVIINFLLFIPLYGQGQNKDTIQAGLKKNVVYGTLGTAIVIGVATINYERMIGESKTKFITSYWLKIGFGEYYLLGSNIGGGPYFTTGLTGLTGKNNGHFEFNIGVASLLDLEEYDRDYEAYIEGWTTSEPHKSDYRKITPSVGAGYRFQKPDGKFVFRTGYAFPEFVYLSVGFCFGR